MKGKTILLFVVSITVLIFATQLIGAAWTLDACTLQAPSSDPNIDEGQSFTQTVRVTTSGSAGGWVAPNIHARFCTGIACSSMADIASSGGLSTATTNPQVCNNACKNAFVDFSFTVDGNTADDYKVDGRCESGIGDLNTADQAVTVNTAANTAPRWYDNSTDSTLAGTNILHSVNWTDDTNLSGYIFSFINGSGDYINDSFLNFYGTMNWSNVSKGVNTTKGTNIAWKFFANDSDNSWNVTDVQNYTTTAICSFSGTVKDNAGAAINGATILIINQSDNIIYYVKTSDATGNWSEIISSAGNYTVTAYNATVSFGGDTKPHINCDV